MTPAAAPRSHRVAPIPSSPASVRRVEAHPASPLGCLDAAPSLLLRDDVAMLFQSFEAAGDGSTGYWLAMPALLWRRTSALLRFDPKRSCPEGMASVFKLLSLWQPSVGLRRTTVQLRYVMLRAWAGSRDW